MDKKVNNIVDSLDNKKESENHSLFYIYKLIY